MHSRGRLKEPIRKLSGRFSTLISVKLEKTAEKVYRENVYLN